MSQAVQGLVVTYSAGETITAGQVLAAAAGTRKCVRWLTATSDIIGVAVDDQFNSDGAVEVQISGIAKVTCGNSVSSGAIVGPETATGEIVERAAPTTVTTQWHKTLGLSQQAGSSNATIEVLLQIQNSAARVIE